jgi:transcriptional regulator
MYQPAHFRQPDDAVWQALLRERPFATLVTPRADGGFTADHLPLLHDAQANLLVGHVARANPLWREAHGREVLAIFQGADAYISPSWYAAKAEHGKVVPTWNYAVVHLHGRLQAIEDRVWLRELVGRLTDRHEAPRPTPWGVDDAPADYIEQMLSAIVGLRIEVTRVDAKWKASQNRSASDRAGVAAGLADEPGDEARAMAALVALPAQD